MLCLARGELSAAETAGEMYHDDSFAFSVRLPKGFKVCPGEGYSVPHGVRLVAPNRSCGQYDVPPVIEVFVGFNALLYESVDELGQATCVARGVSEKSTLKMPFDGLAVPGRKSLICETILPNGAVSFSVMTLVFKTNPIETGAKTYQFSFLTTRARYAQDVAPFREMLRTFRVDP